MFIPNRLKNKISILTPLIFQIMINLRSPNPITTILLIAAIILQVSCKPKEPTDLGRNDIIPKPVSVTATGDYFCLGKKAAIYINDTSEEIVFLANYLADKLEPSTGYIVDVKKTIEVPGKGNIYLTLSGADPVAGDEGYTLTITKRLITIAANKPEGSIQRDSDTSADISRRD